MLQATHEHFKLGIEQIKRVKTSNFRYIKHRFSYGAAIAPNKSQRIKDPMKPISPDIIMSAFKSAFNFNLLGLNQNLILLRHDSGMTGLHHD